MTTDTNHKPAPPAAPTPQAQESAKERRLAEALRRNLARRKAATREAGGDA